VTNLILTVLVCALCAYRLARVVTIDTITAPLRAHVWDHAYHGVADYPDSADRKSRGWAWIYGLLSCPFCAGWWLALGTYAAWSWWAWSHGPIAAVAVAGGAALCARLDVGPAR